MKKKRTIKDYQKIALDLRTATQLLYNAMQLFNRAAFSDEFLRIDRKIQKLKSRVEEEFFKEYPEQADISVFYGSGQRQLSIEHGADYINVKLTGKE